MAGWESESPAVSVVGWEPENPAGKVVRRVSGQMVGWEPENPAGEVVKGKVGAQVCMGFFNFIFQCVTPRSGN